MIDKYYQIIGIFLVVAILAGGGGIVYKQNAQSRQEPHKNAQNQDGIKAPFGESKQGEADLSNFRHSKVNINTASQEELETLPGIGPVKAKAIIDFREKEGKFKTKKDIIKVKGIGEKTYEKIKDKISVE